MNVFRSRILPTLQCKFVQFLVFYSCTKSPYVYSQIFISSLLSNLKDPSIAPRARGYSVLYVGSFVARFLRLSPEIICNVLNTFCEWGREYSVQVPKDAHPDLEKHHLFYMVFNCFLYILCFRSKEICFKGKEMANYETFIERMIRSPLNPMLFVQKYIRKEICRKSWFSGVANLIKTKTKQNESFTVFAGKEIQLAFPFDPFQLSGGEMRLAKFFKNWGEDDVRDENDGFENDILDLLEDDDGVDNGVDDDDEMFGVQPMDEGDSVRFSYNSPITGSFGERNIPSISSSSANSPANQFIY